MAENYKFEDVMQALRNADAAGDVKAAERLAQIASSMLPPQQAPMTAGEVATKAVSNIPSSFANLVGNIVQAVTNPVETAKSVLDVGAGALQNALPERFVQFVGEDKRSRDMARKVGEFYADRYGTGEGLKRAIAEDPVGVLADLSTVISGGAMAAPRAVAQPLTKVASYVDPLSLAAKGVTKAVTGTGQLAAPVLGMTTGAGREAIKGAYQAGRKGGETAEQFRANITGKADPTEVLDLAKANLQEMSNLKQAEYRSGMVDIKNDKTVLEFGEIDSSLNRGIGNVTFNGKVIKGEAAKKLQEAKEIIDDWKSSDPATFHTPEGFDALKQKVGDVLESIPFEQKSARDAVGNLYSSIKDTIQKQAPTYATVMKDYSVASEKIREIQRTLSLNSKSSTDTAMRKLQSLMRDNVQTNYGQRTKLAQELERVGGREFMPGLAGQALANITPRGLQTATALPTGYFAYGAAGLPGAALSLASSSPRAMGETAYAAGMAARKLEEMQRRFPLAVNPQLYNLLYQSGQIQGLLE
jgi:hypothetical protein